MKKPAIILLTLIMILSVFTGCGKGKSTEVSSGSVTTTAAGATSVQDATNSGETTVSGGSQSDTTASGSAGSDELSVIGNFAVAIDSARKGTDVEGRDVIVVQYRWQNNSMETTAFLFVLEAKAFQNGVECDMCIEMEGVNTESIMKEMKPGATMELEVAYYLTDNSDVEINITQLGDKSTTVKRTFDLNSLPTTTPQAAGGTTTTGDATTTSDGTTKATTTAD